MQEGIIVKFLWSQLPLLELLLQGSFRQEEVKEEVLSSKKKFNHIIEIHKDPTS